MMLDAGASPEHTYHKIPCEDALLHFEPIILAAKHGSDDIVKLLLDKGVDPDPAGWVCPVEVQEYREEHGDKYTQANPIFWALTCGQESVLRILVTHAMRKGPIPMATLSEDQAIARFYTEHLPAIVSKTSQVHHNFSDYFQVHPLTRQLTMVTYQRSNSCSVLVQIRI